MSSAHVLVPLDPIALEGTPPEVARRLLGARLQVGDGIVRIVETEAYGGSDDAASHAAGGPTSRNRSMFGQPGLLYVYLIYGMYHCANVVCGPAGEGAAVLIRAAAPERGIDAMRARRPNARRDVDLTNGPGKLCQSLGLSRAHDGLDLLTDGEIRLLAAPPSDVSQTAAVRCGPRVGITRALERPWRFTVLDDPYVSGTPATSVSRR